MELNLNGLRDIAAWQAAGIALPQYDVQAVAAATREDPVWLHFGAGNIFRGFIAVLMQRLLNSGKASRGIIVADTFDPDIIDRVYTPYDNLTLNVTLNADASTACEVVASVAEALRAGDAAHAARLAAVFEHAGLQMVSFTITEKGYALHGADGALLPAAAQDMEQGPDKAASHAMGIVAAGLYRRYLAGGHPIAMVSMDNCAANGRRLRESVLAMASAWQQSGLVPAGFTEWLADEGSVSFPWSMIDKITPRPDAVVEQMLTGKGVAGMHPFVTDKGSYMAPYVNAERPQYLVVEDRFPAGRPPLEAAGVYMTDRDTVNRTEKMKVTTCLNPLHTAMSVYGCLLGYTRISDEMKDDDLVALIKRLGYVEGMPVVTDPGILSPKAFIDEVVEERFPNPFLPDAPQRIVTDTSQKVGIRFGETIKSYVEQGLDMDTLVALPLAIAGWLRYLLAVDDTGAPMELSPDPMRDTLQAALAGVVWNDPASYHGQLRPILQNAVLFGSDLTQTPLADKIEEDFIQLLAGAGAVRDTLRRHLA